jgi:hypothetical protein
MGSWGAGEGGTPMGGTTVVSLFRDREFESELEAAGEWEWEGEQEISPVRRVYLDAMMEHIAHEAAEAESEDEAAEEFLPLIPMLAGKLLPIAAKVLPKIAGKVMPRIARAVTRAVPQLSRGVSNIARTLYRDPRTRQLIRTVPTIARRTVSTLARQAGSGRAVTPQIARRVLAQHAHRVLTRPQETARVLRRNRVLDTRYHGSVGTAAVQPPGHRFCPTCGTPVVRRVTRRSSGCCCSCNG